MSNWEKLKSSVAAIAPTLGASLGGPFGAAAGRMVSKILTGNEDSHPDEVARALQEANPDKLVKLKELDNEYRLQMEKLGISRQKLVQLDRGNARQREIDMACLDQRDITPPILAFTVTIGFFGVLTSIFFIPIVSGMKEIADVLIGALGSAWISIVSYYFGSSFNAERTNDLTARQQKNL